MTRSNEHWFDHEKLEVYQESIAFVAWLSPILENAVRVGDVKDHLDRASTSVPLNIAEGNGKYAPRTVAASSTLPMAPPWNAPPGWTLWWQKGS